MDNMTGRHIFLFLAGGAVGAFAMHLYMGPIVAEAVKGLSSWH